MSTTEQPPIRTATVRLARTLNGQEIGREVVVRARTQEMAERFALAEANSRLEPFDGTPSVVVGIRWH